jgi:hypothetical protein
VIDLLSTPAQTAKRRRPKSLVLLQLLALLLAGGWLGYDVFARWHWEYVEQNWISTNGTIETAFIRRASGRHINWETGWTYSYSVDGQTYEANSTALRHAYFVHMFSSKARAEFNTATRPPGSMVPVYYDPRAPQHSVLDLPQDSLFDILTLGLAASLTGLSIWGMFMLAKTNGNAGQRLDG